MREFATREGIKVQRLYWWRSQTRPAKPAFVEVAAPLRSAVVEIALASGHVVRVPAGFCDETLRRLLVVLGEGEKRC